MQCAMCSEKWLCDTSIVRTKTLRDPKLVIISCTGKKGYHILHASVEKRQMANTEKRQSANTKVAA